ncbi:MAG: hypothetical protein II832_10055 [Synergistaceae bacterium]|nr:hypothetical protein [Synergistaceae bacterium]
MRKLLVTVFMALIVSLSITPSFAARVRAERNTYFIEDAEGYATIQDGKKQQAREEARRMAYRDAIDKAMEMFAGSTDAEMRNKVFAKSQSMVRNFKITSETVSGDTLFITGSCSVGERAFDGVLGPEVISMLGNPRVMIIVDEESGKNASVVENELLSLFEKAGYLIVDKDQAQTLLALDPKKAFSDPEMLAGAAKTIKADIIIVAHATSGAAHAQRFGIHMYKPSGTVQLKAVLTKTAYQISSSTISRGSSKWQGSSSAAGIIRSGIRQAAEEIIYKIAYRMASAGSALGGVTVNIKLAGASFKDMENFTSYLKETGQVFERSYSKEMSEIDLVSPKSARNVASLISDYSLPGGKIEVDGLTAQTVSAIVRPIAPQKKEEVKQGVQYVVINIFLDKLGEDDARRIEYELRKFVGSGGEVQGDFQDPQLTVNVRFAKDSDGIRDVKEIEAFLKNDMKSKGVELLIDKPEGNSIKGSKPGGILDRLWW